jgi:hypothetical protein
MRRKVCVRKRLEDRRVGAIPVPKKDIMSLGDTGRILLFCCSRSEKSKGIRAI